MSYKRFYFIFEKERTIKYDDTAYVTSYPKKSKHTVLERDN